MKGLLLPAQCIQSRYAISSRRIQPSCTTASSVE